VRSRVEIVADVADDGRPVLVRLHAEGQLAVRATGPGQVHLVGAAAGPLGGDRVEVSVRLRAGARLALHGVAATLALPGRDGARAHVLTEVEVCDGAHLTYRPMPLVVCRGALVRARTTVVLCGDGQADVTEQVVLGRHGEPGGEWTGRLVADRDGAPLLRTAHGSALLATATVPPDVRPARAVLTRLITSGSGPASTTGGAVCCPLAGGGLLVTAIGTELTGTQADAEAALATLLSGGSPAVAHGSPHPGPASR
jgi:urease accessory protein